MSRYRQLLARQRERAMQDWAVRVRPKSDHFWPNLDLALEAHELARGPEPQIPGVDFSEEQPHEDIHVSRVHVRTKQGEKRIGKRKGRYITLEAPGLRRRDPDLQTRVVEVLRDEFQRLFTLSDKASVLVVGLGNANVTPDAFGPLVVERLFVTRHVFQLMPELLDEGYRTVSAIAPGVLGVTGIETLEVVRGVVEHVQPDLVVALDALASRSLARVNATIQIADSGIHPGSGVGNHRRELTTETLGVPVYAIGVPTVVQASTIASDCLERLLDRLRVSVPNNGANQIFDHFSAQEKRQMVDEVLSPLGDNLMVTPKEVDEFIEDISQLVAKALNLALHPEMTMEEADVLTH
ncbi:GPR endopeptidase [Alicyclobacillus herbarius]|uniref:GPR endopeptidase n=1 Tax=Alicyclobacillus herbarius TaxID=122960 RepID=UPI0023556AF0|nr:GPR endopeptidase [Alicyclobacillus herbarius]